MRSIKAVLFSLVCSLALPFAAFADTAIEGLSPEPEVFVVFELLSAEATAVEIEAPQVLRRDNAGINTDIFLITEQSGDGPILLKSVPLRSVRVSSAYRHPNWY